jgi:hypothetical protein
MNIQDNAQRSSIDYYKELKTVKKEIEKIYKQLAKDETLPEMIEKIQTDLNKNITYMLTNLSKPKSPYKEFNTKIMKIITILKEVLTDFTVDPNIIKEFHKKEYTFDTGKTIENNVDTIVNTKIEIPDTVVDRGNIKNIIKNILILEYYYTQFEKNITTAENNRKKNTISEKIAEFKKNKNIDTDLKAIDTLSKKLEDITIEIDKEKYINLLNYIQVTIFDIFEYVDKKYKQLKDGPSNEDQKTQNDREEKKRKETNEKNLNIFIDKFKKDIYYNIIINNSSGLDTESQLYENGNEKVELEARKSLLEKLKDQLDKQLKQLKDIIDLLIKTEKQEYGKEITDIQKEFKDYKKEKEYNDNILTIIVNEEGELKNQLDKNSLHKKILTDKVEQDRMKLQRDIDIASGKKGGGRSEIRKLMRGGDRKPNKYYEDKYVQIKKLNESIDALINKIAEIEGKEDADKDPFSKKKGIFGDTDDEYHSIYNSIWKDYKKEMNKIKSKGVTLDSLKQDERLYERIKENNLDPQDVLKITFQDKVIFICIILIIRTFSLVLIELLIEYNIVSTLSRGILVYLILYLLLLITGVLIINYDSYKLRILVNYLNIHINSSNIFFHTLLFCLFIGLILIIINDDDNNLKSIDNIFNYTYVYKYIYEIAEKSNPASHLLLTQKEKLKLQYRMDIITMIIFIFSSLLILIM